MVQTMMKSVGKKEDEEITFEDFKEIVFKQGSIFSNLSLETRNKNKTLTRTFSLDIMEVPDTTFADDGVPEEEEEDVNAPLALQMLQRWYNRLVSVIRSKVQFAFWVVLYTLVMLLIFAERAYFFS